MYRISSPQFGLDGRRRLPHPTPTPFTSGQKHTFATDLLIGQLYGRIRHFLLAYFFGNSQMTRSYVTPLGLQDYTSKLSIQRKYNVQRNRPYVGNTFFFSLRFPTSFKKPTRNLSNCRPLIHKCKQIPDSNYKILILRARTYTYHTANTQMAFMKH